MQIAINITDVEMIHLGVVQSLVQEFETHHLPRLLRLKDKVDNGEVVDDIDLDFLSQEIRCTDLTMHMTINYPELNGFCSLVAHFCKEICDEAMENETK